MGRHEERQARRLARGSGAALLLGLSLFAAKPAHAEELEHRSGGRFALELGGAAALTLGSVLLPSPEECRWCSPPGIDLLLHSPWPESGRDEVAFVSHALAFGALPLGAIGTAVFLPLGHDEPDRHALENLAIVSEAVMLNLALTITVKKLVARRRPAYFYGRGAACEFGAKSEEKNLSFFSGDSSVAFTLASAASTLAFLRGYPEAPYVLAVSGVLAGSAAALRVASDVHWPTDVLTGSLVGTAVGVLVPLLLHPREDQSEGASVSRAGLGVRSGGAPSRFGFGYSGAF
jgi:membrane-associated phospholipid phosphatase